MSEDSQVSDGKNLNNVFLNNAFSNTAICDLLGCRYPIIQTAMGWVATSQLVIATVEAGAFGFLAGAVMTPHELEEEIQRIKAATRHPFGVNFLMHQPGALEIIEIIIKHKDQVRAVSYGRGPKPELIQRFKDNGILCIPTIGALKHAVKAVALGADAVIIQGGEGGGHTGSVPTLILLAQVLDTLDVPVVAAGGFHDGRGLAAALSFGAAGIAMGTRFMMTQESPTPDASKKCYLGAEVDNIPVTQKVDGLPQRCIRNDFLAGLESSGELRLFIRGLINGLKFSHIKKVSPLGLLKEAWGLTQRSDMSLGQAMMSANSYMSIQEAMVHGRPEKGVLPSGQIAGILDDLPSCKDLISGIVIKAREQLLAASRLTQD